MKLSWNNEKNANHAVSGSVLKPLCRLIQTQVNGMGKEPVIGCLEKREPVNGCLVETGVTENGCLVNKKPVTGCLVKRGPVNGCLVKTGATENGKCGRAVRKKRVHFAVSSG